MSDLTNTPADVTDEDDPRSTTGSPETSMYSDDEDLDYSWRNYNDVHDDVQRLPVTNKPRNDKRNYSAIKLQNGLTALLISDYPADATPENGSPKETADHNAVPTKLQTQDDENHSSKLLKKINFTEERKVTCGLWIGVGDSSDPPEVSGMANFMKYSVVTGSELKPLVRQPELLLKNVYGTIEAFTRRDETEFKVTIVEKLLHEILDGFAQFFIKPTLKDDVIRLRQFIVSPINMANDKLYEKLDRFKKRHYRAHNMTVAIEAELPLDSLEKCVKECFTRLPADPLPIDYFAEFTGPALLNISEPLGNWYFINALDNVRKIEFVWRIPSPDPVCTTKSLRFISWVLGHKGKGSLLSCLRRKNLCWDVSSFCQTRSANLSCKQFTLLLMVTDDGYDYDNNDRADNNTRRRADTIAEAVFAYIRFMREQAPLQQIYHEFRKIEESKFRFSEEVRNIDVSDLRQRIIRSVPVDYVAESDLLGEYDPVPIKSCMAALTPKNVNIFHFGDRIYDPFEYEDLSKIEPWFKSYYDEFKIACTGIGSRWKYLEPSLEFALPEANVFLADDFVMKTALMSQPPYPVIIFTDPLLEVWCKPDKNLTYPVCHMNFHYVSTLPLTTPTNAAMLDLYVRALRYLAFEELYLATVVGLKYNIAARDRGLMVEVSGFSQKLPLLLEKITKYMVDFASLMSFDLWTALYLEQRKEYYETFSKSDVLAEDIRLCVARLVHWSAVDKRQGLRDVLFDEFIDFGKTFVKRLRIQCLTQGSLEETDVISTAKAIIKSLKCLAIHQAAKPRTRVTDIPPGVTCCRVQNFDSNSSNSYAKNYYQLADSSTRSTATIAFINTLIDDPSLEEFRSLKGMDCHKYRLEIDTLGVVGYSIVPYDRSNLTSDPCTIDEDIERFRAILNKVLTEMTDEEFLKIKEASTRVKDEDISLNEEVKRNWAKITSELYDFDKSAQELKAMNEMKVEDLRKWIAGNIVDGHNFRKLRIQVVGNDCKDTAYRTWEYKEDKEYSINYLTDLPNQRTAARYIMDLDEYKRRDLHVFAVSKS